MRIKHEKNFWAGVFFVLIGAIAVVAAQENDLGSLSHMGLPIFRPFWVQDWWF